MNAHEEHDGRLHLVVNRPPAPPSRGDVSTGGGPDYLDSVDVGLEGRQRALQISAALIAERGGGGRFKSTIQYRGREVRIVWSFFLLF